MRWFVCIAVFALFLSAVNTWAYTYYIDFVNGLDANNGTTTSTPWQHCPGDSKATNVPASATLNPGDKVIFRGGVVYTGEIILTFSGSAGNVITYDGNSAGTFGTGQAIIDANQVYYSCFFTSTKISYVNINYLELRNLNTGSSNEIGLVYDKGGSNNCKITNCVMHEAGNLTVANLNGRAVFLRNGSSYWEISYNTLYDCGSVGMDIFSASYCSIHHNTITDKTVWGIRIDVENGNSVGNQIYNNTIHDMTYFDELGPHVDFVFLATDNNYTVSGTLIYNNLFYNNETFTDNAGTAFIYMSCGGGGQQINGTVIWNNVFFNQHPYVGAETNVTGASGMAGLYIYSNSFGGPRSITDMKVGCTVANGISDLKIENNIFWSGNPSSCAVEVDLEYISGTPLIDYNCYYSTFASPLRSANTWYSWAAWKALGFEVHGILADPLYVNSEVNTWNLQLQSGSPAIGAGVDLGSSYKIDILGKARPVGTSWDIGAYEMGSSAASGPTGLFSPPTGLRLKQ